MCSKEMDYEGKSLLEAQADPQTAINTADIAQLKNEVIVLARTDAFCSIEAVVPPPTLTYQPSYEIEQSVQLLSNDPALYNKGYVQAGVAGVVMEYTEIGGLSRLVNDLYYTGFVVGICSFSIFHSIFQFNSHKSTFIFFFFHCARVL